MDSDIKIHPKTYPRKLTNGRILLPKELAMAKHYQTMVLTVAPDPCLVAFDEESWAKLVCIFRIRLPLAESKELRILKRFVFGYSFEMAYPKNRYLTLPQLLRRDGINNEEAIIIDFGNRFELWDKARYASKTQSSTGILPQTAHEILWSKILTMM